MTTTSIDTNYCTLEQVKAALKITPGDATYDQEIQDSIAAGARMIDDITGRRFYPDADALQARYFLPQNSGYCLIDDMCEFTSLETLLNPGDLWSQGTDFYLEPLNAPANGQPYTAIRTIARPFLFSRAEISAGGWSVLDGRVTLTGKFGWATPPDPIRRANLLLASRLFHREQAPFGILSTGVEGPATRLGRLDPDVATLLEPYTLTLFA